MSDLNELSAALAKAQGAIDPAPKDADNPFFKSKYASLPAVREAMRHAFAENGLSVVQIPEVVEGQLRLRTLLLHSSGQSLDCGSLGAEVDLANPQKIGSAITYFRRYALAAISQTVADEDDDGNVASHKPKGKPKFTAEDQRFIATATQEITETSDFDILKGFGETLKKQSPAIQDALRPTFTARWNQLKAHTG